MKKLIINADDLGINSQRSHGIFLAAEHGGVSSATIIPNGSDSDHAARHALERELPSGLHINLTSGPPLSKDADILSLLTTDGYFLGSTGFERTLKEGQVETKHIEREIRSQIEWFLEHYGQPTHVDSHHHIHVHPFVSQILISIVDRYGIAFVRIPSEPKRPFGYEISPEQSACIEKLSIHADVARKLFAAHGIQSTEHFRGLVLAGNASNRNLRHTIGRLPEGTTELMVHPGSPNPSGEPFDSNPQRQTELNMLTNPEFHSELKEREIVLCSFGDLF